MTFIYALLCPTTGSVRYIGKADNPAGRLKSHIRAAATGETKHATARWILHLLETGKAPILRVLSEVPANKCWQDAEKAAIAEHIADGCDLTNSTSGGQGLSLIREEDRIAISASMSAAWNRPGAKEMRRAALIAGNAKPEAKKNRIAAAADPLTKQKHAAALQAGLFGKPEVMARRRASQKLAAQDPEVIAKKAAATRARWADPEYRARLHEKQKAAWVKRKQGKPCTT